MPITKAQIELSRRAASAKSSTAWRHELSDGDKREFLAAVEHPATYSKLAASWKRIIDRAEREQELLRNPDVRKLRLKASRLLDTTPAGRNLSREDRNNLYVAIEEATKTEDIPREWKRWWDEANRQLGMKPQ